MIKIRTYTKNLKVHDFDSNKELNYSVLRLHTQGSGIILKIDWDEKEVYIYKGVNNKLEKIK